MGVVPEAGEEVDVDPAPARARDHAIVAGAHARDPGTAVAVAAAPRQEVARPNRPEAFRGPNPVPALVADLVQASAAPGRTLLPLSLHSLRPNLCCQRRNHFCPLPLSDPNYLMRDPKGHPLLQLRITVPDSIKRNYQKIVDPITICNLLNPQISCPL